MKARFPLLLALLWSFTNCLYGQASSDGRPVAGLRPSDVFGFTNVWAIHSSFTPEQWDAMEPKQGGGPRGGPRRGSFLQGPEGCWKFNTQCLTPVHPLAGSALTVAGVQ